jgi:methanogenic corrinoid protein MtbC1
VYHRGVKPSKIAKLTLEDITNAAMSDVASDNNYHIYINQLTEASIDFDEERFEKTFQNAISHIGFENCIIHVIYPYLEKIGLLWMTDHVIPAQEHFSSNLINRKIIHAIDKLEKRLKPGCKKVLLFTPEGEHHEMPLLFLHYMLKKNGHLVVYHGTNISPDKLQQYINQNRISHLHFHLITKLMHIQLDDYVEVISKKFEDQQIIFSGPKTMDVTVKPENVRLLKSMKELMAYVKE